MIMVAFHGKLGKSQRKRIVFQPVFGYTPLHETS